MCASSNGFLNVLYSIIDFAFSMKWNFRPQDVDQNMGLLFALIYVALGLLNLIYVKPMFLKIDICGPKVGYLNSSM